jgi:hypothetical protein
MARIELISDLSRAFHPDADPRNVAMIRRRHAHWAELATRRGWDLAVRDAALLDGANERASVRWIDLPMLPRARHREVFERASVGSEHVHEHPFEVERVLGLDRFHAVLLSAGVPTPRTALVPVDDALAAEIDAPSAVRALLTARLYEAMFDAGIDPHEGVYVRGFYSSAKSANPEHYFGSNQADVEATVFEVIRRLRVSLELGGLALREHLDLERIELFQGTREAIRVPFEVRMTVLDRRLIMASYHGPFEALTEDARGLLVEELMMRSPWVVEAVNALWPALRGADLPSSYVADLAFPRDGGAVVLELNPLYAAGYNVPAAHALLVASLGAFLAKKAGYPALTRPDVLDEAAALAGARVEESAGVWVMDQA